MIYDDLTRQILLVLIGCVFIAFALWALIKPELLATILGYELKTKNAFSEFYAIYIGVFIAQSVLCALAFVRIQDAVIGDLVSFFLLSQPVGRLVAVIRTGFPSGIMQILFAMELVAGLILLAVRPSA